MPPTLGQGVVAAACPAAQPSAGTPCAGAQTCTFGDDPAGPACRASATCSSNVWHVSASTCVLPSDRCAAPWQALSQTACTAAAASCGDGAVTCTCTSTCANQPACEAPSGWVWDCNAPNADPNCPAWAPNIGAACAAPDAAQCSYLFCTYACQAGLWQLPLGVCPTPAH